ncbi:unnamed protein product [Rhizoctonia solani]|uniref:RING-CH-type domain-containing protein n=1 Tax=Rhizoctonia solani TaxID=456999 RepID=A0A8H3E3H9_9AGAM|nr:unnamed protein product [Rhizoctonia solani]
MSGSTKSTIKFALLAYSVFCWVDGSARTHNSQGSDLTRELLRELQPTPERGPRGWKAVWEWISSRGPSMSEEERTALGRMDVIVSFFLFNSIQKLSFRSSSIQTPSILPASLPRLGDAGRLRWKVLILAAGLLSLVHETQRAAIIYYIRQRRANMTNQLRKDLDNMRIGQIAVQGDSTIPQQKDEDEEEEECLICSGSAETMSTSSHADSSMTTRMGPLEAFCTIAPQKHLAHRQCFLRWHAAYLQQSRHSFENRVTLLGDSAQTSLHQLVVRASVILQASGFDYLATRLVQQTEQEPQGDSLTIHTDLTSSDPHLLATLRTCTPPCPGCRSPVRLRFIDTRPPLSHTSPSAPPQRVIPFIQKLAFARFWRAWMRTVTGRTVSAYFGSLLSFMAVLAAITRVRGNHTWAIRL